MLFLRLWSEKRLDFRQRRVHSSFMRTKQPSPGPAGSSTLRTLHPGDPVRDRFERELRKLDQVIETNMAKAERLGQEASSWGTDASTPLPDLDAFSLAFERAGREVRRAIVKQMELEKSYRVRAQSAAAEQERVAAAALREREARGRKQIEQVVLQVIEGAAGDGKETKL
jgi:hypothetical protein